ncbi:WD domain containing protein [Alternaria alternata]|nr:WD domain containing protein [Alternaria alternata]
MMLTWFLQCRYSRIERYSNLRSDLAGHGVCDLDDAICSCRVQRRTINAVSECSTASLVSPCAPDIVYGTKAFLRGWRRVIVVVVGRVRRQPESLDMAASQAYRYNGLFWMYRLHKNIVLHWERAQVLEHLWAKDAVQLRMLFATASTFFVEPRLGPGQLQPMALAGTFCTWATFHFQHRYRGCVGPDTLTACALYMLTQSFWVNRVRQRDATSCRNLT